MKKYILFLTGLLFLASACNDDDVKGVIEPVTEVECSPFVGSVQMKWKNPASEDWYYTLISYKDADGRTVDIRARNCICGKTTRIRQISF